MSRRRDRTGLGRFNMVPTPVIRAPARHPDGEVICPECGASLADSRGTHRLHRPNLADRDLQKQLEEPLLVHGWQCVRHQYDVVVPVECRGREASNLPDGWVGVRLVFADEVVRWVATPEQELEANGIER